MTVVADGNVNADRGKRDSVRHRERLRKEITTRLRETIGEENIIAAGPDKRVRVSLRSTKRFRFIHDRGGKNGGGAGQGDGEPGDVYGEPAEGENPGLAGTNEGEEVYEVWLDMNEVEELLFRELGLPRLRPKRQLDAEVKSIRFDEIARRGSLVAKKATVRENMLRNAKQGELRIGGFERDDLRYVTYREAPKPRTQAVAFLMMDISGSIGEMEKRISRLFFYWTVRFLRSQYTNVEVVFIGHTATAQELSEEQFFTRVPSGGTIVSSAYRLAREIQRDRYPESDWNSYVIHSSDGDNLATDNEEVVAAIRDWLTVASLVGYLEVKRTTTGMSLLKILAGHEIPEFVAATVSKDEEVWPALKTFFARHGVDDQAEELESA